jgi:hypothetical protein
MCHGTSGAFRKTTDGQWVHAFCAEVIRCQSPFVSFFFFPIISQIFLQWLLGTKYVRGQDNLVAGMVCTSTVNVWYF